MEKNYKLADETLRHIEANQEYWNQFDFFRSNYHDSSADFCETTACFAGTALLLHFGITTEEEFRAIQKQRMLDDNPVYDTADMAREALGWNEAEAYEVFYNTTTDFEVLREVVTRVLLGDFANDSLEDAQDRDERQNS